MNQKIPITQIDGKIYNVTIQALISEASTSIKFPCLFYVLWKTNDQQYTAETGKHGQQGGKVSFNQTITLQIPLIYERTKQIFLKKETQIQLNLISKSRPDQSKLVGRVTIDVAALINNSLYPTTTLFQLQFCSVNATLSASFKVIEKIETETSLYELQKSIGDGVSFTSNLKSIHIPQSQKKQESISFGKDLSPIRSKTQKNTISKEVSSRAASPKLQEHQNILKDVIKDQQKKQRREMSSSTLEKVDSEEKTNNKSVKISGLINSCHKKIGSVLSEESKASDEAFRLRGQMDVLKLESSRQHQEDDRIRKDLESKLKEGEFIKMQLKQKQSLLDQTTSQNVALRKQTSHLREDLAKLREQAVANTIKIAQLKDSYNRVSAQLATSEREIRRLDVVSQQSSSTNKQYIEKIDQLQKQLRQCELKCRQLQSTKSDLLLSLSLKQDELVRYSQEYNKTLQVLETEKISTVSNIEELNSKLTKENEKNKDLLLRLQNQQKQITKLLEVQSQFLEAKHSWDLTQGLMNEEINKKGERITQLQDALMSLSQKLRCLQSENQLLTENSRKSRQQHMRLQEDRIQSLKQAQQRYEACLSSLQQQRKNMVNIQSDKKIVQQNLLELNSRLQQLQVEHETLVHENLDLFERQRQIQDEKEEKKNKIQELQELLLLSTQQRQRELSEAASKENTLLVKVKELENQNQTFNETILLMEEKVKILEQQLQGREDLVIKLQEGLNTQIERTEAVNAKLIIYFQKDEKMKDLTILLQQQERRLNDLINEQQQVEIKYLSLIKEREKGIVQLASQLEISEDYANNLISVIETKDREYSDILESLNVTISELTERYDTLFSENENNLIKILEQETIISDLEHIKKQMESQFEQNQRQHQTQISMMEGQKQQMIEAISHLQNNIEALNVRIHQKQEAVLSEMERCNNLSQEMNVKQQEITQLQQLILQKESQTVLLQKQKNELQGQISLKDQMLQEENIRFQEIQQAYNSLYNDQATFDLMTYKEQMKVKNQQIQKLEAEISVLGVEVSKAAALERSLKIKTIELNSMKYKGNMNPSQTNELIRLKDQQIASLLSQKDKFKKMEKQFINLQTEVNELKSQLEEIEEQKFNIQSELNQRALLLQQAKQQNRKLMDQLTIIGQKHGELEKMMLQTPTDGNFKNITMQTSEKSENILLKRKNNELQQNIFKLQEELRQKQSGGMNQNKKDGKMDKNLKGDISEALKGLKKIFEDRGRSKIQQKMIQSIQKWINQDQNRSKSLEDKTKSLSRDFNRLKTEIMKVTENQHGKNILGKLKNCQTSVNSMVLLLA